MKRTWSQILLLLACSLVFADNAFANAGTPLMWASSFHLIFGNAVIGVAEGLLIAWLFKVGKAKSILIMILANHISMIAGRYIVISSGEHVSGTVTIYWLHLFLALSLVIFFALTVVVEWPFCAWILKAKGATKKHSLKASLYAQVFSYSLLVPFYLLVSGTSLLWNVDIEKDLSFAQTNPWVYFVTEDGKAVERIRVQGGALERLVLVETTKGYKRLFPKKTEDGEYGLYTDGEWRLDAGGGLNWHEVAIPGNLSANAAQVTIWDEIARKGSSEGWSENDAIDYRSPDDRGWQVHSGLLAIHGLTAEREGTTDELYIALETPFLQWYVRNVTVLPGNQVVFQLGGQIVLLDIETRKLGLITNGRGPLVVFDD